MFVFVNYQCNMHRSVCKQGIQPKDRINWWFRVVFFNLPTARFSVSKYWKYLYVINLHHSMTIGLFTWLLFNCTCNLVVEQGGKKCILAKTKSLEFSIQMLTRQCNRNLRGILKNQNKTRPSMVCVTHQMSRKKRNYSVCWTVPYEMMNYKWYLMVLGQYMTILADTCSV